LKLEEEGGVHHWFKRRSTMGKENCDKEMIILISRFTRASVTGIVLKSLIHFTLSLPHTDSQRKEGR
jgi:hypothetical protein